MSVPIPSGASGSSGSSGPTGAVVAVIGAGARGTGIAQIAAQAGHPLLLRHKVAGGRTFHAA